MTGEISVDGFKLLGKESGPDTGKKKKKSQREDGIEKESSHKKKSSLSNVDDLDKTSVHQKKSKEAKSADMDKSGHNKKKKKERDKGDSTPLELDKSTHKKKKNREEESIGKASTHKHKVKAKDDLDKGSKHPHRHSKTESTEELDKVSSHQKKSKDSESLEKSSRDKKKAKDMDKSSHKKHKSKSSSSLDESSTHDAAEVPSSSATKEPRSVSATEKGKKEELPTTSTHKRGKKSEKEEKDALPATSTHKRGKKSEKEEKDALPATSMHKRVKKSEKEGTDTPGTISTHKRGKKSEKDGLGTNSTHKEGKRSEKDGKDALDADSKDKRGKKSEKDGKDALGAASTHRRGKKSDVLQAINEEASETNPSSGEHLDQHRRGKKKDVVRETVAGKDDANNANNVVAFSASDKIDTVDDKAGSKSEITMDTTTRAQKIRLSTIDDASGTSDDDSSMGSFGEEGDDYRPPPQRIAGSDAQVNREGTRGPAGVFLSRQNSKNLGRILSSQASEDDIFAALEAEAENLKDQLSKPKLVTRGLTRSKSSNSHRSSSFDKKQKGSISEQQESNIRPKWQPGQEIKPMAAEDLRAMLNIKSPPKRIPSWRDSRWFRDDVVPSMPLTLALNAIPSSTESTFEPGKLVTLPNGTVKMLRADQCEDMKVHSTLRKSLVKDALRQSLNATIH